MWRDCFITSLGVLGGVVREHTHSPGRWLVGEADVMPKHCHVAKVQLYVRVGIRFVFIKKMVRLGTRLVCATAVDSLRILNRAWLKEHAAAYYRYSKL